MMICMGCGDDVDYLTPSDQPLMLGGVYCLRCAVTLGFVQGVTLKELDDYTDEPEDESDV